jgi:4-amino-4-deoxy-L-arabinose transferase-like glycosyltransferase
LPSVLATLALALALLLIGGGTWLGTEGGFLAAVFFLVNFTMVETGRLAELEALYIAMTGIGLLLWIAVWLRGANPWRLWLLPAPALALGMLVKGPTHLIFYYGVTVAVLVFAKKLRLLLHPAHWIALLLIVGLLGCWAVPCSLAVNSQNPMGVWSFWWGQLASRASTGSEERFRFGAWLLNGPQTLKNFLPWTLLLPLLWQKDILARLKSRSADEYALFRGARLGMIATCLLMVLLPKGSPRYIYPLIVVPCLLLGRTLSIDQFGLCPAWLLDVWKRLNLALLALTSLAIVAIPAFAPRNAGFYGVFALLFAIGLWTIPVVGQTLQKPHELVRCAALFAGITGLAMTEFSAVVRPRIDLTNTHRARPLAAAILENVPFGKEVWVLEESYRPFWFYLEPRARYFDRPAELPPDADFFLVPATRTGSFVNDSKWSGKPPSSVNSFVDSEEKRFDLLRRQ